MDFGIGFISTNIMLPILDFFYGIVPSYGFSIIALTLVIRLALYPFKCRANSQYAKNENYSASDEGKARRNGKTNERIW